MKTKVFTISTLCIMAVCSCGSKKTNTGITPANLDTAVRPQDNFYEYACGGWMKNNPLKPEFARYGTFDALRENNQTQLNTLIQGLSEAQNQQGSVEQKVGGLYKLAMDSARLNEQGGAPIKAALEAIAAVETRDALVDKIIELHTQQIAPFFSFFGEADFADSKQCIAWLYQGGLGLGEREYYLDTDERSKEIRAKYVNHIAAMLAIAGYGKISGAINLNKVAEDIMALETTLAQASMDKHTQRDPSKIYHKKTAEELAALAPNFKWQRFFEVSKIGDTRSLNIAQPDFIKAFSDIVQTADLNNIKAYLAWQYIDAAAGYLSDDFVQQNFEFYGKVLSGKEELRPRWKRAVDAVNGALGEAVGQAYVAKYFPPSHKERMLGLVSNLQSALSERISGLDWMTDTTKAKAQEKLATFTVKIGYPDKWRDYSNLEINGDESYWENILRSNRFDYEFDMSEINKPLDKAKWHMFPQTVNAYYNPTTNEICFPAGILQPPFFNMDADDAVNYGAIGVVIGHEMTHGFDDQGRKFDKEGNMTDWWTAQDDRQFVERAQVLIDYFNGIRVLGDLYADGKFTLGENIADYGGVQVSYVALQKALGGAQPAPIDGFTAAQRFFVGYATVWAGNIRDKEIERLTKMDVHSLGRWRINGILPHIDAFVEAFGVQPSDGMYLSPEKRAKIW